jgi:hypothetical protein
LIIWPPLSAAALFGAPMGCNASHGLRFRYLMSARGGVERILIFNHAPSGG